MRNESSPAASGADRPAPSSGTLRRHVGAQAVAPDGPPPPADGGPSRLVDSFGRLHDSLRVSVIDRCNIRCFYCMPAGPIEFLPADHLLRFDQIEHVVRLLATVGVRKIRLTGGEPLLRRGLPALVRRLAAVPGIDDLALTTNGILLDRFARPLREAGLRRVNISLDTLREETFQRISRRRGLDRVLAGIDASLAAGFASVRLNALAIRGLTDDEIVPLASFALERSLTLRFIEYMPLDADRRWDAARVLPGDEILDRLAAHFGPLDPLRRDDPSQPAEEFAFAHTEGRIGIIRPVSRPFCGECNRLRLTAEGALRNCLFSLREWDLRAALDAHDRGAEDAGRRLLVELRRCLAAKEPGHLIEQQGFEQPDRPMYRIGG